MHTKYNPHPFDMSEYFAGQRFVIEGIVNDWDTPVKEEKPKKKESKKKDSKAESSALNLKHIELRH